MTKYNILLITILLVFATCKRKETIKENTFDKEMMLRGIADNYILQRIKAFDQVAVELEEAVALFVDSVTLNHLEVVKHQWKVTNRIYKECRIYNIGAIKETYAHLRIETRPANSSFIENNIADSLAVIDDTYFETIGFSSKGLGGIEYLLFHDTPQNVMNEFQEERRKAYLKGAVDDVTKNMSMISNTWRDSYYQQFCTAVTPGLESSVNLIVNKLVEVTEKIYQEKLGKPLGKKDGIVDANRTEAPLSRQSVHFIQHELTAIEHTFKNGLYDYLDAMKLTKNNEKLSKVIQLQIQKIQTTIGKIDSIEEDISNQTGKSEVLYDEFKTLLVLLKVDVISGLNIIFMINDNDGD
ncbi:MAG: imelysin family protein [Flavobacteriales bacterium]|jgi:predicted lipoprotein|nr:imelysin family protein [Flavobacteriales bacterium]